ncbi:hypothetical protein ACXIZN_25355 [Amycolatopsis sp. TRM77291]
MAYKLLDELVVQAIHTRLDFESSAFFTPDIMSAIRCTSMIGSYTERFTVPVRLSGIRVERQSFPRSERCLDATCAGHAGRSRGRTSGYVRLSTLIIEQIPADRSCRIEGAQVLQRFAKLLEFGFELGSHCVLSVGGQLSCLVDSLGQPSYGFRQSFGTEDEQSGDQQDEQVLQTDAEHVRSPFRHVVAVMLDRCRAGTMEGDDHEAFTRSTKPDTEDRSLLDILCKSETRGVRLVLEWQFGEWVASSLVLSMTEE